MNPLAVDSVVRATTRGAVERAMALPSVARLRARLKDAWWAARALAITNPPLPPAPRSVLFLCHGNICRSPFAALLAARLLGSRGAGEVACTSAGFRASPDASSPPEAVKAAAKHGISLAGHQPTPLTAEMIEASDVVVVMEARHLSLMRRRYPADRHRFVLLPLFAEEPGTWGYRRCNIADPYGRPDRAFEDCYAHIAHALGRLATKLATPALVSDMNRSLPVDRT